MPLRRFQMVCTVCVVHHFSVELVLLIMTILWTYYYVKIVSIVVFCNKAPILVKSSYLAISSLTFVLLLHVTDFQNSIIVLLVFDQNKESDVLISKFQRYTNRYSVHIAHSSKPLNWAIVRITPQTCIRVKVVAVW